MLKNLLSGLFGSKPQQEDNYIVVQINDKIMPIDRGTLYEDPIIELLAARNYGEVTGGGTMQEKTGELLYCDIEILLHDTKNLSAVVEDIREEFEKLGAPKGSKIHVEKTEQTIDFGKQEGLAIYLDGVNLPADVYKECDSNYVLSEISRLIGYDGDIVRYWQGNTETALYFYGASYAGMNAAIADFVNTYPLCRGARIVQIA